MTEPYFTLNTGKKIPAVGFGCAFGNWTDETEMLGFRPELAWHGVTEALKAGYQHLDTAHCYATERHVGDIVGRFLSEGKLQREDLFITTKLAHPAAPPHVAISHRLTWNWTSVEDIQQRVMDDFEASKDKLGMGYVDLLLMHWPGDFVNKDKGFGREARLAIWEVFESLNKRGDAHAIGVCNFTANHIEDLISAGRTVPALNQFELHPYCQDPELESYCQSQGILVEAYAPFASGAYGILKDPVISEIAQQTGRSTGQVILRWQLQCGRVVLPKSSNPQRMAQNLELFDFELSDEQIAKINALAPTEAKRSTVDPATIA